MVTPGIAPVRVGLLFDYIFPPADEYDTRADWEDGIRLVLEEAHASGMLDRPVELVSRDVFGLPNGNFGAVRRAFHELVDEDCVLIFGPIISENAVPLREHVEAVGQVATLSTSGSEDYLGPWTFALNNGSLPEEPSVIASVIRHDGHRTLGVLFEESLIGMQYLEYFRKACATEGLEIVREVGVPQVERDKTRTMTILRSASADAIMHVGFGHGVWGLNDALAAMSWDPSRYTTTAFELAYMSREWMRQFAGFVGVDQYDERNALGQAFLDRFAARYGRRPNYYGPGIAHDLGQVIAHGLAGARPLTGRGVRDAIEKIKMLPAASGAPGTRLRYGKYIRQGWMGAEYLVARRVLPDGSDHVFHGTINGVTGPNV
jgi:branched-chain amino acid transport system substrate-binding protein